VIRFDPRPRATALACALACALPSIHLHAQGVATEAELAPVVVHGTQGPARNGLQSLAPGLPSATATKTATQLRDQNLVNPEDALQYLPNTTVRKRYIGDRNALIAGRSFGTLQPSRALVYLDGYLISNFLGRFDAPRWNMVSPEAIERVDMLYGPYSALFPGNSIGTTVAVTQHTPKGFEASGRVIASQQTFKQYGQKDHCDAQQLSLHLGQKLDTGLWFTGDVNHQDSTSQPMQYAAVSAEASTNAFPTYSSPSATPTAVTGVVYDTDPKGLKRAIFGANAGAIDHTVQDTLNLRAGYRFTPTLEASVMGSWWGNTTETRNVTFLRDSAGNPVWQGAQLNAQKSGTITPKSYYLVSNGGNVFELPASSFAPSTRDETHQQLGATLKTRNATGWNGSVVISDYRILNDEARQADNPDPTAANGGSGTLTRRDGTGWNTFEVQGTWTPSPDDWTGGRHALAFGLHRNGYQLDNTVETTSDWRQGGGTLSQYYRGRTEVVALYAQDAWRLHDDLKLTLGWREEQFRAFDGHQFGSNQQVNYADRTLHGHSPKASLAWHLNDDLLLRLSAGRGVRFPNVEELYNGTVTSASVTQSDPNLKPETSDAIELSAEQTWASQRLRVSLFHDEVQDAILRQTTTDANVCKTTIAATNYTCVQNVDRVKTTGIEFAWQAQDLFITGLSLDATAAFTNAKVTANAKDPKSVGKWWLRVPRERATVQASYQWHDDWRFSAGYRHEGRAYNDVTNEDVHPDVYGGVSSVNQMDLRGSHKLSKALELALGINNVLDARAYQSHPYPGRTLFAELRFNL